jgi:nicotinamidase-related amidase
MSSAASFRELIGVQPSKASVADSTLIIIDAQNEYAEGKLKCSNTASSRKVIASLLQKYRDGNGKIVHVVHDTPDGAPVFTPGTKLAEEFEEHLGGGKIVLTGYMVCLSLVLLFRISYQRVQAHVCVSTTARQGAELGYDVICVEDAIGDRSIPGVEAEELTKTALNEIADAFGTVIQSSEIK